MKQNTLDTVVKHMTVSHNTDTIILRGLDVLDLTANQDGAGSIFFHQAVNDYRVQLLLEDVF